MVIIKFKVSRDRGYTVVNNTFINDKQLDAREKGLLLVLMSKPDHWDMSIEGLRAFCADGTTALRKGIQKLEEHGYTQWRLCRPTRCAGASSAASSTRSCDTAVEDAWDQVTNHRHSKAFEGLLKRYFGKSFEFLTGGACPHLFFSHR